MTFTKEKLADQLFHAYQANEPLSQQAVEQSGLTPENAYDVQHAFNRTKGEMLSGYKISLTSKETQDLFHSDSPLYGEIVASKLRKNGATLKRADMNVPLLELEIECLVKEELSATDSLPDLLAKCDLAPGVEVPDSRFKDWFPSLPLVLVIADSAVCGCVVVGDAAENKPDVTDLSDVHASLTRDGKLLEEGNSSEVLGNPLHALKWLVDKLAQEGRALKAGTVVSTGTFCMPQKMTVGHYEAVFDHGLGCVSFDVQ
ncbi:MAG: fumarylacetoacetate hydrolase family protein [Sporolactobacillus sp.]